MTKLDELWHVLYEAGMFRDHTDLQTKYERAFWNEDVRGILEIEIPHFTNLTGILNINDTNINGKGSLHAIRLDCHSGGRGLEKSMVAGLILKGILDEKILRADTLTDAGDVNTGYAMAYYGKKFGLNVHYVMSHHFPQDVIDDLVAEGGPGFKVERVPVDENVELKNDYDYLSDLMKNRAFKRNKYYLGNARHGGEAIRPLGRELATELRENSVLPDFVVLSIGAGSTLECFCELQDYLASCGRKPEIVVAEHEASPIYADLYPDKCKHSAGIPTSIRKDACMKSFDAERFRCQNGYHNGVNPFLVDKPDVLSRIKSVQQYSEDERMKMSHYLECRKIYVENSSAANMSVATGLANKGHRVLTVIY